MRSRPAGFLSLLNPGPYSSTWWATKKMAVPCSGVGSTWILWCRGGSYWTLVAVFGHGRYLHKYDLLWGKFLHAHTWVYVVNSYTTKSLLPFVSRVNTVYLKKGRWRTQHTDILAGKRFVFSPLGWAYSLKVKSCVHSVSSVQIYLYKKLCLQCSIRLYKQCGCIVV